MRNYIACGFFVRGRAHWLLVLNLPWVQHVPRASTCLRHWQHLRSQLFGLLTWRRPASRREKAGDTVACPRANLIRANETLRRQNQLNVRFHRQSKHVETARENIRLRQQLGWKEKSSPWKLKLARVIGTRSGKLVAYRADRPRHVSTASAGEPASAHHGRPHWSGVGGGMTSARVVLIGRSQL